MKLSTVGRTLQLLALLGQGRFMVVELAAYFKVSERTIYRDIREIERAGYPITSSGDPVVWYIPRRPVRKRR